MSRFVDDARLLLEVAGADLRTGAPRAFTQRLLRISVLAAILLALLSIGASAAEAPRTSEPLYQVEILVVRSVTPIGVPEDWSVTSAHAVAAAPSEAEDEEAHSDAEVARERLAVRTLSPAQFRLAAVEASLQRNRGYEVLRHVGWTQAATARGAGLAVELADIASDGQSLPLRGTVALERGKYLHLKLDLSYTPESAPSSLLGATTATGPITFTLQQQRRVRPFERHYFDHPAFGVIAMVSPVT